MKSFPTLGYLRDIVFMFHMLKAPTTGDLPDLRLWKPADACLSWKFDDEKG